MNFSQKSRDTFKRLLPRAAVLAFEVVGGVFSLFWGVVMIFSAFLAAGLGMVFAQEKVIPYLGLTAGWLSSTVHVAAAFVGALVAVIAVELVEFIVLLMALLAIAGVIALIAGVCQSLKQIFSR
jgi:hypothetical protein